MTLHCYSSWRQILLFASAESARASVSMGGLACESPEGASQWEVHSEDSHSVPLWDIVCHGSVPSRDTVLSFALVFVLCSGAIHNILFVDTDETTVRLTYNNVKKRQRHNQYFKRHTFNIKTLTLTLIDFTLCVIGTGIHATE